MPTPSLPRRLDSHQTQAIVGGNDLMNHGLRDATVLGNLRRLPRIYQRIVDNEPALSAPGTGIVFESVFDLFNREVGGGTRDSCHGVPLFFSVWKSHLLNSTTERNFV